MPGITEIALTSDPGDDDTYAIGDAIEATVTFTGAVTVTGTPQMALDVGGAARTAHYASGSGSTDIVFSYTVVKGDLDADGVAVEEGLIDLNSGTITADGTAATLTYDAVAADPDHKVDGVRPILESATVEPDGKSITLVFDEFLVFDPFFNSFEPEAHFSVTADGNPITVREYGVHYAPGSSLIAYVRLNRLTPGMTRGQVVTVSYTPTTVDDPDPLLQDAAGNGVFAFTTGSPGVPDVVNNVRADLTPPALESAAVLPDGATIELVFDGAIDDNISTVNSVLVTATADGNTITVGQVAVGLDPSSTRRLVQLQSLSPAITHGQVVIVSYSDPDNDNTSVLQDPPGNDVVSFTTGSGGVPDVVNNVPLVPTVEPTELWSDTMTVGSFPNTTFVGWNDTNGYAGSSLSDQEFDYGEHTYDIETIAMAAGGENLTFRFNESGAGDIANAVTRNKLTLHVGSTSFKMTDGSLHRTNRGVVWPSSGLSWVAGDMVALKLTTTDPGAPGLTATTGSGKVKLSWTPPTTSGGSAITGYEYRQRTGDDYAAGAWTPIPNSASLTSYEVTGLTADTAYTFQLRARNSTGAGLYSAEATATPRGDRAPVVSPRITGAPLVGSLLTVDTSGISDARSSIGFSYQWIRIHASGDLYETNPQTGEVILFREDGDEALLGHVTGKTYRPTVHDLGSRLYVVVSYTDRGWNQQMRTTPATVRITAPGKLAGDFDLPSGIDNPRGIWGNDETIWVPDVTAQIYPTIWAVDRATRHREPAKDFTPVHLDADNIRISGIWSDGTTMYVVNSRSLRDMIDGKIYAYSLDDKSRVEEKDIDLASGNDQPRGSWGNATTLWVVNDGDSGDQEGEVDKVFAYRLTDDPDTEENEYGARDPDQDFDTLEADGVGAPAGIWSDGTTMWVVDRLDRKAYAYAMSDRSRLSDQDITLDADNELAAGAWGDIDAGDIDAGEVGTLWVVDNQDKKLYAYPIRHTTPSLRSNDGLPTISSTPKVGQTLTADTSRIGDPQGMPEDVEFRCRWARVVDGRDLYINQNQPWNCSYTVHWRYVGLPLKVEVRFFDARGGLEIRRSVATDPVAGGLVGDGFVPTVDGTVSLEIMRDVWGNDETIWVSKAPTATVRDDPQNPGDEYNYALTYTDNLLLAYNRSDGSRAPGQDIRLQNRAPGNIWSDGETMFVVDSLR